MQKDSSKLNSLDGFIIVSKFEDGPERLQNEPAFKEAILGLVYGADPIAVLDQTLRKCEILRKRNKELSEQCLQIGIR